MNKKLLIVIILIILGFAGYYLMNSRKAQMESSLSSPKSLKELIAGGVAQRCTYSTTVESGTSEGTTYVAGGKMRGDFTLTASGKTTKSHMITDGKTNYIWVDGEKTGLKTTIEETSSTTSGQGQLDLDEKVDYKCSTWITDSSQFAPPSDIQFTDYSQMFNPSAIPSY